MSHPSSSNLDVSERQLREACAELERRLRAGESGSSEQLLEQYPSLGEDHDLVLELIYCEFATRIELGQHVDLEAWYARFPQLKNELKHQFSLHDLFLNGSDGEAAQPRAPRTRPSDDEVEKHKYELLEEIGHGAMGVVYKAHDQKLDRIVALKMVVPEVHLSRTAIDRFRFEATLIAQLSHPNIVQVYEVGDFDGAPYVALEYVSAGNLEDHHYGRDQSVVEVVGLVRTLALAVHAAHQIGIVHRDLKPANILLTADGTPKIADFGLAIRLDESIEETKSGAIVGTVGYMAPEQAGASAGQGGTVSDVYSLGAILYRLLAGQAPFSSDADAGILTKIREEEPLAIDALRPDLPKDVASICMRCLRKSPSQRYSSAKELADDLGRYLAGEPVQARSCGSLERIWKWSRRRPAVAGLAAFSSLAVVALLVGSLWFSVWQNRTNQELENSNRNLATAVARAQASEAEVVDKSRRLEKQLDLASRGIYAFQLAQVQSLADREPVRAMELLEDEEKCPPHLRDFTWRYWRQLCDWKVAELDAHTGTVRCIAYSPDSKLLATGGDDQTVVIWDVATGKQMAVLEAHADAVNGVVFAAQPDGSSHRLATASNDGTVKMWEVSTGRLIAELKGHEGAVRSVDVSHDGRVLATAGDDQTVRLWDARRGQSLAVLNGHTGAIDVARFSPDGTKLATASEDHTVRMWDVSARELLFAIDAPSAQPIDTVAFTPDGQSIGFPRPVFGRVSWWDVETKQRSRRASPQYRYDSRLTLISFGRQGDVCLTGGVNCELVLHNAVDLEPLARFGNRRPTSGVMSPDGRTFAVGDADGTVEIWRTGPTIQQRPFGPPNALIESLALLPGDCAAMWSRARKAVWLWNEQKKSQEQLQKSRSDTSVAVSSDGRTLAVANIQDTQINLYRLPSGKKLMTLADEQTGSSFDAFDFDPRGAFLATGRGIGLITIWDLDAEQIAIAFTGHQAQIRAVSYSPDGSLLATAGMDRAIRIWDTSTWRLATTFEGHTDTIRCLRFSPSGDVLVSGGNDRSMRLWSLSQRKQQASITGFSQAVTDVEFTPDGATLAAVSGESTSSSRLDVGELKLVDPHSGQVRSSFPNFMAPLAFLSHGESLIVGTADGLVNIWSSDIPCLESPGAALDETSHY